MDSDRFRDWKSAKFQFSPSVRRNFDRRSADGGDLQHAVSIQSFGEKEFRCNTAAANLHNNGFNSVLR